MLLVDTTLRVTLRKEAEEDWTCEGTSVRVGFLFNTGVRKSVSWDSWDRLLKV